jgi:hypothetical protein
VKFEVITAMLLRFQVSWNVTLYQVEVHNMLEVSPCLRLQGPAAQEEESLFFFNCWTLEMQALSFFETDLSVNTASHPTGPDP